jgi:hypothetical protein
MDPVLSLAFSMHATRGAYALLLGSGVSRSSGVPTGWEVVLDLIEKLSRAEGEESPSDLERWYRERYQSEPDYSKLLEGLAPAPGDRQALLRPYFEPTPEEREQNLKVPTAAHHAVAELVERGFVRVIVTTNFDRLLEAALEARGIAPNVIASPNQADGALPLAHSRITIIKLHGDYLDTRLKNTPAELAEYDERIDRLLDQVFDEYGLVACGWSAEWDEALRAAIERCKGRRFSMYFTSMGEPGEAARRLIDHRGAFQIAINSADEFFVDLKEKLVSLEEIQRPHPVSKAVAVASLKRYLPEERHRIRLHDLVTTEIAKMTAGLKSSEFDVSAYYRREDFVTRVQKMEALSETAEALFAVGGAWSSRENYSAWQKALQLAVSISVGGGSVDYGALMRYPALRLFYGAGIAATMSNDFAALKTLFTTPLHNHRTGKTELAVQLLAPERVIEGRIARHLSQAKAISPLSDHLFTTLRPAFDGLQVDDSAYEDGFNSFEYLLGLTLFHVAEQVFIGRLGWKWRPIFGGLEKFDEVREEAVQAGVDWAPLRAGLFNGEIDTFLKAEEGFRKRLEEQPRF